MSLTDNEIRLLLGVAMSYDNRKLPGDANRAAWAEAAHRGRWSLTAAVEALHEHYATSTEFLMPGHITQRIRADVRQPPPFQNPTHGSLPAGFEPRALPSADEPAAPRPQLDALARPCSYCGATPGQRCTRRGLTGRVPLTRIHPSRKDAAP